MTQAAAVRLSARPIQDEDFWTIRTLLVETTPFAPPGLNWDVRRWEGQYFYNITPGWTTEWRHRARVWVNHHGQLAGVIHPEGLEEAHIQIQPDLRHYEAQLLEWAEQHMGAPDGTGKRVLHLFVQEYDTHRQRLLAARGFEKLDAYGVVRNMRLSCHVREVPAIAAGYSLRATHPEDLHDCQHIADLLNAAFGRDVHTAREYQVFAQSAPSFRRDLDLVAVAPDGSFAAYVGIPYDAVNRAGIFEPVCTHPDHRRRGLARTLMLEGLRRLKTLGATSVTVGTGDMLPANRLYDSVGFTEAYRGTTWRKVYE